MNYFILFFAFVILSTGFSVNRQDQNMAQRYNDELKFAAEEAAAAAAAYFDPIKYSEGSYVFNQQEGIKAAEYVIKKNMKLNDDFNPQESSYWQEKITYKIEFFDDSNVTYPFLYNHVSNQFTLAIGDPTVVVTINGGKARYRLLQAPTLFRTAAHTWNER